MFAYLSKFLPLFVFPLGLACFLLIFSLLTRRSRRFERTQVWLITLALLILWIGGSRWTSYALARSLEWRYLPGETLPQADVIVILGGGTEPAQPPRPVAEVTGAGDRVLYGAYLFQQGAAHNILVSGGVVQWVGDDPTSSADDMAGILNLIGIPDEKIWIQRESGNTYEDALLSKRLLQEKGIHRVILVTSAMHMPRAVALFENQNLEVIPAPADFTVTKAGWERLLHADFGTQLINLLPSANSLTLTTNVLREYIGMFIYRLRGWM